MTAKTDACTAVPAPLFNRTLPASGAGEESSGTFDSLNLIFVVGLAVLITVLARFLSGRGRRK